VSLTPFTPIRSEGSNTRDTVSPRRLVFPHLCQRQSNNFEPCPPSQFVVQPPLRTGKGKPNGFHAHPLTTFTRRRLPPKAISLIHVAEICHNVVDFPETLRMGAFQSLYPRLEGTHGGASSQLLIDHSPSMRATITLTSNWIED
jgi:hypothetical protein